MSSVHSHNGTIKGSTAGESRTLQAARAYLQHGLSEIPIRPDGTKAPAGDLLPKELDPDTGKFKSTWKPFQNQLPTLDELQDWFGDGRVGLAVICGAISGNVELLDFDAQADAIFQAWRDLVEAERPGLIGKLTVIRTPKQQGRRHVWYRCEAPVPGNMKLAVDPGAPADQRTLIETRGEGGYALAPGCPPQCHETGRLYEHESGPKLSQVQTITAEDRETLIRCARAFDKSIVEEPATPRIPGGLSPGDDFCRRGPGWEELLTSHGWQRVGQSGKVQLWRRPGKERGWSATTGLVSKQGRELFCCFSSNAAPFEGPTGGRGCSTDNKFSAYARLEHGGNFAAAAKELASQGFGDQRQKSNGRQTSGGSGRERGNSGQDAVTGTGKESTGYDLILDYFKKHYQPSFRRGTAFYSAKLGREVAAKEATLGAPKELIDRLATAQDAPRDKDRQVKFHALPQFFNTWCKSAVIDLLNNLPEEEAAGESDEQAADQFRQLVAAALLEQVTLGVKVVGVKVGGSGELVKQERRSLLHWCGQFAKPGPWKSIRSYAIWTKQPVAADGEVDEIAVALRHELFSQIKADRRLIEMGAKRFARLAAKYGVGRALEEERPQGKRALLLDKDFVLGLVSGPEEKRNGASP